MMDTISPNEFEAIGILFARMVQMARTASGTSRQRKIDLLDIFVERMVKAGYTPEVIKAIERRAVRDLLRAGYKREFIRMIRGSK